MPNWVTNKLNIEDGFGNIDIFTDGEIDFNKIIPMPEELNITSGGFDQIGLAYLYKEAKDNVKKEIEPTKNAIKLKNINEAYQSLNMFHGDFESVYKENLERFMERTSKEKKEALDLGIKCYENYLKYGTCNWYNWHIENWSTKWNANNTDIISDDEIYFNTAWSMPEKIIIALSKIYQGKKLRIAWADEGISDNSGIAVYMNGEIIEGGYSQTKEDIENAYNEVFGEGYFDFDDDDEEDEDE